MKKFVFAFIFFLIIVLVGCKKPIPTKTDSTGENIPTKEETEIETETIKISKIELIETGKTEYELGDEFDANGFIIRVYYSNDTFKNVNVTKEMVDINMDKVGVSRGKIKYKDDFGEISIYFNYSVSNNKIYPVEIIIDEVGKDIYWFEQSLDLSLYQFSVKYSDNSIVNIDSKDVYTEFQGFEENTTDEAEIVTIRIYITINDETISKDIQVYNYSEWIYEEKEIELKDKETIAFVKNSLKGMIPTEVDYNSKSIDLLESSDLPYKGYILAWNSSNSVVITPLGIVNPAEETKQVVLKVAIKRGSTLLETLEFEIEVIGLGPVIFPDFDKTKKQVFAYAYEGTYLALTSLSASKIDFYNYCFGNINADHTLSLDGLNHLSEVLSYRREYKVRVILSIKNGPWTETCSNDEYLLKFVMSVIDVIKEYKFDGIDIDWEFPEKYTGVPLYTKLIKTLREYMDIYTPGKFLTAALIGGGSVSNVKEYYDCEELNKYLDYAHIMTYDLDISSTASHHTNPLAGRTYSAESSIKFYTGAGLKPEIMTIGAAFYGKLKELASPYDSPTENVLNKNVISTTSRTYTWIKQNVINNSSYQKFYDSACGAYYYTDGKNFVTFESPESIVTKGQLINRYKLGGMMFWDLGSDTSGELLQSVFSTICDVNNGRI